jgi:hypothetical protein
MTTCGLIPRTRLTRIPRELRLAHEYCYFLHDQCARLLIEYEQAEAHVVEVRFRDRAEAKTFARFAKTSTIDALRRTGYEAEARRVILNTITLAMVSDCLLHIFEGLRCLERRKTVVALNLLRKPLTDSLLYLSWMLGDEAAFYTTFSAGDSEALTPKRLGNIRPKIFENAIAQTDLGGIITPDLLFHALFDARSAGLYGLFQHAVHLVTAQRLELRTSAENFNFIFKAPTDDDVYQNAYALLPHVLLYLSHVILELFQRIKPMEAGGKKAFEVRSTFGLHLVTNSETAEVVRRQLHGALDGHVRCGGCDTPAKVTIHNASRIVLTESMRCTVCRHLNQFPFSWFF